MDESLIKLLIFILLIGGSWALRAMLGSEKPAGQPQRPPQPRPMPPPPDPRRQAQQQVAEFLEQAQAAQRGATGHEQRQVRQKQGGKPQQGGRPPRGGKPASPPVPAARPTAPATLVSRTSRAGESDPYGESVAEHVSRHLSTREFDERAKSLSHVADEQARFSQHVRETFDHQVGTLAGRTIKGAEGGASAAAPTVVEEPSYAADQLLAWLRDPASLRQAIVLHEVLERPASRW